MWSLQELIHFKADVNFKKNFNFKGKYFLKCKLDRNRVGLLLLITRQKVWQVLKLNYVHKADYIHGSTKVLRLRYTEQTKIHAKIPLPEITKGPSKKNMKSDHVLGLAVMLKFHLHLSKLYFVHKTGKIQNREPLNMKRRRYSLKNISTLMSNAKLW